MTSLTGLDKKDEHHLLVQDLLVIIPVEMVRLYFETVSKEEPPCCCMLLRCFPFCFLSVLGYGTGLDGVLESFYWYKYTCTLS